MILVAVHAWSNFHIGIYLLSKVPFFLLFLPLDPDPRTRLNPDPTRIRKTGGYGTFEQYRRYGRYSIPYI